MDGQIGGEGEESKMRIGVAAQVLAALLVAGCGPAEEPAPAPTQAPPEAEATIMPAATPRPGEASLPESGLPPFAERTDPNPDRGSWIQQLEPDETEFCTFTERPASDRPAGLIITAWSGNMDLWTEGYVLGHDHAIGFVEAMWMKRKPVIAARAGMPDLWIEPVGDFTNTILRIGPDELTCVRWEG